MTCNYMIIYINIYKYVVINNITGGFPSPEAESPQLWTPIVPVSRRQPL